MSRLTVGSLEGLSENSNVISVPTGHTLNAVDGLQIGGVAQGVSTAFTPSWTNVDVTSAVERWEYVRINDLLFVSGITILGTATPISGFITMDIPVGTAIESDNTTYGTGVALQGGTSYGMIWAYASSTSVKMMAMSIATSYVQLANTNASVPFTWASGNQIRGSFTVPIS